MLPPMSTPPANNLEPLRQRIDALDEQIIALLSERAKVVVDVGEAKRGSNTPIYAPHRERAVLERIANLNDGPLSNHTLESIYRELMSGSFALEQSLRIGFLGPPGSFSHLAAVRHFGQSVEFTEFENIEPVFTAIEHGHCDYGLVPYENSTGGSITDTLDAFHEHNVHVYAEALIGINHCLLSNAPQEQITRIASRPQVFGQCAKWLARHFPHAQQVNMASTSLAVQSIVESDDAAAIGSELAGTLYGANLLYDCIQDKPNNVTRFLIIALQHAQPSGTDKTSISFVTHHQPGALVDVLAVFRDAGINLSHIDKRPSGRENWQYMFYIDADAHADDPAMNAAITSAEGLCQDFRVLGSYPRAEQVL
jgi:chorismate mutase/prephenate dehydratase